MLHCQNGHGRKDVALRVWRWGGPDTPFEQSSAPAKRLSAKCALGGDVLWFWNIKKETVFKCSEVLLPFLLPNASPVLTISLRSLLDEVVSALLPDALAALI